MTYMDTIFKFLLAIHIPAGFLGLILFWIPVFTKKGGNIHKKAGKGYVVSMWIVVVTATILCMINAWNKEYISASFLGFISILTAQPLWYGISILKYKNNVPLQMIKLKSLLSKVLFFSGSGLLIWGILSKAQGLAVLLIIFGIIGLTAAKDAFGNITIAQENSNWLKEHIAGMIGTGIASHTAFFAFGGATFFQHIFSGPLMVIPWVMPSIVGAILIVRTNRKHGFA